MPRIGEMACWNPACVKPGIAVSRTAGGKLQAHCHKCGMSFWPTAGHKGERDLIAATIMDEETPARTPSKGKPLEPELPPGRIPEPKVKPRNLMDEL